VIKLDTLENQVNPIYLGIGSNLGNRKMNIEKAKFNLMKNDIKIIKSSNYYESLSWPNEKDPKFLNIILEIVTNFSPINLLKVCKEIEIILGRKKRPKNYPRECDIDLIDFRSKTINQQIILPHPNMHKRNFVLFPLFELNKNWQHPISKLHIKRLISLLSDRDIRSIKQI
tara:strand:- start:18 stop:530 length:513 start_codon:yes stop_codon:yes gene_type:complete